MRHSRRRASERALGLGQPRGRVPLQRPLGQGRPRARNVYRCAGVRRATCGYGSRRVGRSWRTGRGRRLVCLPAVEGQGEQVPGRSRQGDRAGRSDLAGRREGCAQAGQVPAQAGADQRLHHGVDRQGAQQAGQDQGPDRHRGRCREGGRVLLDAALAARERRGAAVEWPEGPRNRVRRLRDRHEQARFRRAERDVREHDVAAEQLGRRRSRPRHVRRRDRRGLRCRLCRCGAERRHRDARRDGRHRHGPDERRHRRGRMDLPEQERVQHPRRQLLAALRRDRAVLQRPARPGGREALVRRRRCRGGCRQLRQRDGPERGALCARQRPVRDHRRCDGPRRHGQDRRRRQGAVVGLRQDVRRLLEA